MTTATTFVPTVAEATAAGFFPSRHEVEVVDNQELTDGVYRLTFRDEYIASHAKPAQRIFQRSKQADAASVRRLRNQRRRSQPHVRRGRQGHRRICRIESWGHHSCDGPARQFVQDQGARQLCARGRRSWRASARACGTAYRRHRRRGQHRGVRLPQRAFRRRICGQVCRQGVQHRRERRQRDHLA